MDVPAQHILTQGEHRVVVGRFREVILGEVYERPEKASCALDGDLAIVGVDMLYLFRSDNSVPVPI